MTPFKVRCFFCNEIVLDLTCDMVEVSRTINTRPKIIKKQKVYRCQECKDRQRAERKAQMVIVK